VSTFDYLLSDILVSPSPRTVTIKLNKPRSVSQDIITVRPPSILPTDAGQKFNNIHHQIANVQLTRVMDTLAQPA
jgi:hypothetical protein